MPFPETCIHCNLPIPPEQRIVDLAGHRELHFCCPGCRGAYAVITGAGLDAFYTKRSWDAPGTPEGAFATVYTDEYLENFIIANNDCREIAIIVAGIRCAACIWLIESILGRMAGVEEATINYGTHRGRIRFDPTRTSPAQIFQTVSRLGYVPKPFTRTAARTMQEQENKSLLIRFGTAAFLSFQLMMYSIALYGGYFKGMDLGTRQILQYFAALVATPVVFFSGAPFLKGAWRSLVNRTPNMDLLIALGVLTAYCYSLTALLFGGEIYFETSAMIVTLLLLGRLLESGARKKAMAGVDRLLNLAPNTARLITGDGTTLVTSTQLKMGDIIEVRPGDRFPVDGTLLGAETEVDESVLTGEADPVLKKTGDPILSGAINISTAVRLQVEQSASLSFMARIGHMVEEAQNRRAPVQGLADRVAGLFVPSVILIALGTGMYWYFHAAGPASALMYSVSVLVVACPCALGLATPTAILVATGVAAAGGILFRGGDTLEATSRLSLAAFDKTGTLTDSIPQVVAVEPIETDRATLLNLAARAETGSNHPLAHGIIKMAETEGINVRGQGGTIVAGRGVRVETEQGVLLAGSRNFMEDNTIALPAETGRALTEVHVALNEEYQGCLYLDSRTRDDAAGAIAAMSKLGLKTVLLTGDHLEAAKNIASRVGISKVHAGMSPADKEEWVREARRHGETVLMVGDGVNDAPALSEADVGCAMSGGTDLALETSDLVLIRNSLEQLPAALELAKRTMRIIRQNLFWAFTYNLVAIPLAATGRLAPVYAAAAMATSSICVVANSLRLKRFRSQQLAGQAGQRRATDHV